MTFSSIDQCHATWTHQRPAAIYHNKHLAQALHSELDLQRPDLPWAVPLAAHKNHTRLWLAILHLALTCPRAGHDLIRLIVHHPLEQVQHRIVPLINGSSPAAWRLGLEILAAYRADPGQRLDAAAQHPDDKLRLSALKILGLLGRTTALPLLLDRLSADAPEERFQAAWSAVRLGDRATALDTLWEFAVAPGPHQTEAVELACRTLTGRRTRSLLSRLWAMDPETYFLGAAAAGDPNRLPYLIELMDQPELTPA